MDPIRANNSIIYFDSAGYTSLNDYIEKGKFSKIFILVDDNTHVHCLPPCTIASLGARTTPSG